MPFLLHRPCFWSLIKGTALTNSSSAFNNIPLVFLMLTCWIRISLMNTRVEELLVKDYKLTFNPKGNQSWIFIGRTEAVAPILWSPDMKSWLIGKEPDAGKNWDWEEKGAIEDKMIGWHHWLNGHEFVQTLGDTEGQGNLACCNPWGLQSVGHNLATKQQ